MQNIRLLTRCENMFCTLLTRHMQLLFSETLKYGHCYLYSEFVEEVQMLDKPLTMVDLKLECLTHGKVHVEEYFADMKLGTSWGN